MCDAGHQHDAPTAVGWTQHFGLQVLMMLKDICVVLWLKEQTMTIFLKVWVSCEDMNYREITGVVRNSSYIVRYRSILLIIIKYLRITGSDCSAKGLTFPCLEHIPLKILV